MSIINNIMLLGGDHHRNLNDNILIKKHRHRRNVTSHHFTSLLFTSFQFYVYSNFFCSYQLNDKYNTQMDKTIRKRGQGVNANVARYITQGSTSAPWTLLLKTIKRGRGSLYMEGLTPRMSE